MCWLYCGCLYAEESSLSSETLRPAAFLASMVVVKMCGGGGVGVDGERCANYSNGNLILQYKTGLSVRSSWEVAKSNNCTVSAQVWGRERSGISGG